MKTAVFASLIAGAAAFAPAKTAQSSTALAAAFGEEVRAWDASKPGLDFDVSIVTARRGHFVAYSLVVFTWQEQLHGSPLSLPPPPMHRLVSRPH